MVGAGEARAQIELSAGAGASEAEENSAGRKGASGHLRTVASVPWGHMTGMGPAGAHYEEALYGQPWQLDWQVRTWRAEVHRGMGLGPAMPLDRPVGESYQDPFSEYHSLSLVWSPWAEAAEWDLVGRNAEIRHLVLGGMLMECGVAYDGMEAGPENEGEQWR